MKKIVILVGFTKKGRVVKKSARINGKKSLGLIFFLRPFPGGLPNITEL